MMMMMRRWGQCEGRAVKRDGDGDGGWYGYRMFFLFFDQQDPTRIFSTQQIRHNSFFSSTKWIRPTPIRRNGWMSYTTYHFPAIRIQTQIRINISPNSSCSHFILSFIYILLHTNQSNLLRGWSASQQYRIIHYNYHSPRFFHSSFYSPTQFTNLCTVFFLTVGSYMYYLCMYDSKEIFVLCNCS